MNLNLNFEAPTTILLGKWISMAINAHGYCNRIGKIH